MIRQIVACLFVASLASIAQAQPPRKQIEAAYGKSVAAAKLKYVPGMVSIRSHDFKGYSPAGLPSGNAELRATLTQLIQPSLSCSESIKILQFSVKGNTASCEVSDILVITMADDIKKSPNVVTFETVSVDTWAPVGGFWKMTESRVKSQKILSRPRV